MPDWTKSMSQRFEYYIVDPGTWKDKKRIDTITSCTINKDLESDTLGYASFNSTETTEECYIRTYLITNQNGIDEKTPLGTHLVQSPTSTFTGKISNIDLDAYTPLLELKENQPPIGYYTPKNTNILEMAYMLTRDHARAPVIKTTNTTTLFDDFVAQPSDTWLGYISDLLSNAKFYITLDDMGRVLFAPKQSTDTLQPVWTYDDGNSSILYPEFTIDHDIYGIPNVVEVIYSNGYDYYYAKAVNDDDNSPLSIQNRGREIISRITDPNLIGNPTESQIHEYAEKTLREVSTVEYTVTYTHGYCSTRVGDCVRLNYEKAGLKDVKARIISQSIKCEPGCPVTEKAVFTTKLWR